MQILHTIEAMRRACAEARAQAAGSGSGSGSSLGLIPTMGALHEGHLSLVRAARKENGVVTASIFINPSQFGPGEDLARYPRTYEQDCARLEGEGVDLLFAPSAEEMYPGGTAGTFVEVPEVGDRLDGRSRPGHFRGVATVVAKLFHIVSPEFAYFGQKDAAQVAVLRAMVRDLNFGVKLVVLPTVRDADGLALSSRNLYLSAEERACALALPRTLALVGAEAKAGQHDAKRLQSSLLERLEAAPGLRLDYAEIVDPDTLEPVGDVRGGALIAVAAYSGKTRLIDNLLIDNVLIDNVLIDKLLLPAAQTADGERI